MNRPLLVVSALLVGLTTGASIGYARGGGQLAAPVAITPAVAAPETHIIKLTATGAVPNTVIAKFGDQVRFDSADGHRHIMAQGFGDDFGDDHGHEPDGLESGLMQSDDSWLVSFKRPGTFFFHDHAHPDTTATVVVYTDDDSAPAINFPK